jgi:hypothetical protein
VVYHPLRQILSVSPSPNKSSCITRFGHNAVLQFRFPGLTSQRASKKTRHTESHTVTICFSDDFIKKGEPTKKISLFNHNLQEELFFAIFPFLILCVYYTGMTRELNRRLIYECRCDEILKAKVEGSTLLVYTGFRGDWNT